MQRNLARLNRKFSSEKWAGASSSKATSAFLSVRKSKTVRCRKSTSLVRWFKTSRSLQVSSRKLTVWPIMTSTQGCAMHSCSCHEKPGFKRSSLSSQKFTNDLANGEFSPTPLILGTLDLCSNLLISTASFNAAAVSLMFRLDFSIRPNMSSWKYLSRSAGKSAMT